MKGHQGYIYILECEGFYKIGLSKNVERRKKQLDFTPFKSKIIFKSPLMEDIYSVEEQLHIFYEKKRVKGEWFKLSPEDIEEIKEITR